MMKKFLFLIFLFLTMCQVGYCENIHFNDSIYKLNQINDNDKINITNEYYIVGENSNTWSSKIIINYFSDISNPLKYASDFDKKITKEDNLLLLKFVQNKKQDIAVLSYLENEITDDFAYFIYNILKFEKHPQKGIMVLQFAKRYLINSDVDIQKVATEVKKINDDYMERIIISPIPQIVKNR